MGTTPARVIIMRLLATVIRVRPFAVNVAAVVWPLWSDRFFGLRGGGESELTVRVHLMPLRDRTSVGSGGYIQHR